MESSPSHRNVNPLQQLYGSYSSRKSLRWVILAVLAAIVTVLVTKQGYDSGAGAGFGTAGLSRAKAKYLTPTELMARPISKDLQTVPKLFHQSWSSTDLPTRFQRWSVSCRKQHPEWEWVLWTDEDNEELVKKHFPWLLKTYEALPSVIYQADLVRNLYMYMYGG